MGLGYIGWAPETTFGTAVARTKFSELVSESLRYRRPRAPVESFRARSKHRVIEQVRRGEGDFAVELMYEGYGQLYRQLFGTVSPTTGVGPYTHAFVLTDAMLPGLSLEAVRHKMDGTLQGFLHEGTRIAKAEFMAEPNKVLKGTFSTLSEDVTLVTATSATYPGEKPILHNQLVAKLDTVAFACKSFKATLDMNLLQERAVIGSLLSKEFSPGGQRTITGEVVIEFENTTMYADYGTTPTNRKLNLVATGSGSDSWDLELPSCVFGDGTAMNMGGAGPIDVRFPFEAYLIPGGADAVKLTIINSESAV